MGKLIGFQDPPHIIRMREQQAKDREKKLGKSEEVVEKPCRKKSKKTEEIKKPELTDEDMGAFMDST